MTTAPNAFGNLSSAGLEETQDRIGGFRVLESDAYTGEIKMAYAGKASGSNAQSITVLLAHDGGEYRETFWITNRNGENFYTKDGKKIGLPGFSIIDDLCLVTTNKPLAQQTTEEKVVSLYDYDAKKEVPTSVAMLVELLGQKVTFGIQKHLKNKQAKDGNGVYQDTADSREENVTDKIFHFPSNLTVVEARKNIQTPTFYGAWVEKNKGQTQDRRSIKDGASSAQGGRAGAPPKSNGAAAPKTASLFGN